MSESREFPPEFYTGDFSLINENGEVDEELSRLYEEYLDYYYYNEAGSI